MAELDVSGRGHKKGPGVRKGKKLSLRVDLTPMVDLGFLLITFCMFTMTMAKPKALHLILPKDVPNDQRQPAKESQVITLLLGKKNKVFFYEGKDPAQMKSGDYKSIREVLMDKKRRSDKAFFQVILKPSRDANYRNAVAILDEMIIDDIRHYAFVDIDPSEYTLLRQQPGQQ
ncbi:ExbD/TolR family protein [Puia dinghuensis]|uniref:Biopolymer transporter ExbD n=1 Tax=Puia dinghuensis TaxID=1792502 RepID=A0A8J2XSS8_9BACT|nr:biopolymer transporter ExbD [Puia dinghuensis]GGA98358.1 biopolymer transporter ExbD [Puia dinghuensis]